MRLLRAISLSKSSLGGGRPARGNMIEEGVVTLVRVAIVVASSKCLRNNGEVGSRVEGVRPAGDSIEDFRYDSSNEHSNEGPRGNFESSSCSIF